MMDAAWIAGNQRCLKAALDVLAARLAHVAQRDRGDAAATANAAEDELAAATAAMPSPAALDTLCAAAGLSPFERDVILLCAGVELSTELARTCAELEGGGELRTAAPSFGLALAALAEPHWSALAPDAPLRRLRLIEVRGQDSITRAALRLEERVLHHLTGLACLDEKLIGLVEALSPPDAASLTPSQVASAAGVERVAALSSPPLVQLIGPDRAAARVVFAAGCAAAGLRPYGVAAGDVPSAPAERETLVRLWEREVLLGPVALLIELDDESVEIVRAAVAFAERIAGPTAVSAREPIRAGRRGSVRIDVPLPSAAEQRMQWERVLGPRARMLNGELDRVVDHFRLGLPDMRAAGLADPDERLWDACRRQSRPRLEDLAQRLESCSRWDELVLPDDQLATLREIAAHVRHRGQVYDAWGFGGRGVRGLGISALFAGQSGTGKTMAAEVLASELGLDLYRIDLSHVVSKYIGETEKNLRRIFDAAEQGGAILLFDEADALFGKRTEVKDSHDRYANIEVSFLLQKMESYRGLAVLTTNLKNALDTAFLRRIRFVVQFPFPDAAQRRALWQRAFPAAAPTRALDAERLAGLHLPGGNIRNVAVNAAFSAAEAGEPVTMAHVLRAARAEYIKIEKPFTEAELAPPGERS